MTDDLRDQLEAAIKDQAPVWEETFDVGPGLVVGVSDAATVAARALLAADPGDLPKRMQAAIEDAECPHEGHEFDACSSCRVAAAMGVRDEQMASLAARLAESERERDAAVGELSSRASHNARWETEKARADRAEEQRDVALYSLKNQAEALTEWQRGHDEATRRAVAAEAQVVALEGERDGLHETIAAADDERDRLEEQVAALQRDLTDSRLLLRDNVADVVRRAKRAEAERDATVAAIRTAQITHVREARHDRPVVGDCAICQVLTAISLDMPSRPDDPEEIRRLAQATTESTEGNDG